MPGPLLRYFTLDEAVAVEALAERIFPETEECGGASAAHVTEYIDGQLAGPWGQGERMYRHAPFVQPDHAGHGWQSPFTPREAYRYCIDAVERYCVAHFKGHFVVDLTDNELDTLLEALEMGAMDTFEQFAPRDF